MTPVDLDYLAKDLVHHFVDALLDALNDWSGIQTPAVRKRCEEWALVALEVAKQQERRSCLALVQSHHERCRKYCSVGPDTSHDADCLSNLAVVLKEGL